MKPRARGTTALATAAAILATLTACTSEEEPEQPTLAEATRTLANDGQHIRGLLVEPPEKTEDKTKTDDRAGCPAGTARRSYTMTLEFNIKVTKPIREELLALSGYAIRRVRMAGYQFARNASRKDDDGRDVFVNTWRKPKAGVAFTVTAWARSEELAIATIAGRTDCLR